MADGDDGRWERSGACLFRAKAARDGQTRRASASDTLPGECSCNGQRRAPAVTDAQAAEVSSRQILEELSKLSSLLQQSSKIPESVRSHWRGIVGSERLQTSGDVDGAIGTIASEYENVFAKHIANGESAGSRLFVTQMLAVKDRIDRIKGILAHARHHGTQNW